MDKLTRVLILMALLQLVFAPSVYADKTGLEDRPSHHRYEPVPRSLSEEGTALARVDQSAIALADDFADYIKSGKATSREARACPARLAALTPGLKCTRENDEERITVSYRKVRLERVLRRVGYTSMWIGVVGLLISDGVLSGDPAYVLEHYARLMVNVGLGGIAGAWLLPKAEFNPKIPLPWTRRVAATDGSRSNSSKGVQEVFFRRLAQHGMEPPKAISGSLWLAGLTAGVPSSAADSTEELLRARENILGEVNGVLDSASLHVDSSDRSAALEEQLKIIRKELQTNRIFGYSLKRVTREATWRTEAYSKLVQLATLFEQIRTSISPVDLSVDFGESIEMPTQAERLLMATAAMDLAQEGTLISLLSRLNQRDRVQVEVKNFEIEVEQDKEFGVEGLVNFEVEFRAEIDGGKTIEKTQKISTPSGTRQTLDAVLSTGGSWTRQFAAFVNRFTSDVEEEIGNRCESDL